MERKVQVLRSAEGSNEIEHLGYIYCQPGVDVSTLEWPGMPEAKEITLREKAEELAEMHKEGKRPLPLPRLPVRG